MPIEPAFVDPTSGGGGAASVGSQNRVASVLRAESAAIAELADRLGQPSLAAEVDQAVLTLADCQGRAVVCGLGKSGLIAQKIAATLCSTGTSATFLHAADAFHGDFGVINPDDVLIVLSSSGETREVVELVPSMRRIGATVIALAPQRSTLGEKSHLVLPIDVAETADPLALAPMAQSTAMLAVGDALAAAVHERKGFSVERFAELHPGGALGKRLLCKVDELMHTGEALPIVPPDTRVRDALVTMSTKRLGALFVTDAERGQLLGVLTDGDLRRLMQRAGNPLDERVDAAMTRGPKTIAADALAIDAAQQMQSAGITVLPVVDDNSRPTGALHLHDLIAAGLS